MLGTKITFTSQGRFFFKLILIIDWKLGEVVRQYFGRNKKYDLLLL